MIRRETRMVIEMIKNEFHISVEKVELLRLENFIGNRLMIAFYQGYGNGLQETRELFLPKREEGKK